MSGRISAEEGALRRGQQAVNEAKSGIDTQTKKVRGEIEQLGAFWSGAAASSFRQLMNRWDEETRNLNEVLVTLEQNLRSTEVDQAETEQTHQEAITNLGAMMGGA